MDSSLTVILLFLLVQAPDFAGAPPPNGAITFDINDSRGAIERVIDTKLVLRIERDATATPADIGWTVGVYRRPWNASRQNLLELIPSHGPHPADIEAWHITQKYYPNERTIDMGGYHYRIKVALINPVVKSQGADAQFVSGTVKVSWERKR